MKKKNNNNRSFAPVTSQYLLKPIDLKKIDDDAKKLIKFIDKYLVLYKDPQIKWTIQSDDYLTLCKYQKWLRPRFLIKFGEVFHFEQYMWCAKESASLFVVLEQFHVSLGTITEVSKYIYETAKARDCHYTGVDVDLITDDDPRVQWESKS